MNIDKITLCLLILLVIARSEKIPTAKNVETADLLNSRLSTILPYSSLYTDEHLMKDNPKKSLVLLIPVSQTRNEKSKETVQKTKRSDTQRRKNKFLLLSTKEGSNKARTSDKNIKMRNFEQNSDDHAIKNAKYSQKNSAMSKRMISETYKDKMLSQALKDNLSAEDVIMNSKSQEKAKKCNTYICRCEEEDCFSSSSKKSSSRMLGFSGIDEPKKTDYQRRLTKYKNTKPDISQQKSPKFYHENPYELPNELPNPHEFPDLFNYLRRPYSEKMDNIYHVPIVYGITPNVLPHMVGKYVDVGIPFTSFQDRSNYLLGNNQYQPIIHKKPYIFSPMTNPVENSMPVISPSTDYIDITTIKETTNDLESNNLTSITEEDQEHFSKLITDISDTSTDLETETNLNYSTEESNITSSSDSNKVVNKSGDFTKQTERNPGDISRLMTYSADGAGVSSPSSVIHDETNDRKFINMKECIQLFGRDVCILSATSPRILAKQAQENNSNKYSMIRIPEYVTQVSTRKETTLKNNYSDKLKVTDSYFASESPTNGINKSNVNLNGYLESTSTKSNVDEASLRKFHEYPESIEQISEPDINYNKNTLSTTVKNIHVPIKKLMDSIDKIAKTERNKMLGKSKSHTIKLVLNPNDGEGANSIPSEKFLYSTPLYESNGNEKANNLKINQQNHVANINSNSNTSLNEETTVINHNFKTDFKEQNKNYQKESNANIYSEKKIPQEHFKQETTTNSNFKIGNNFAEGTKKEITGIEASIQSGKNPHEQSTTMQYFNDKKSSNLNNKEDITNNLETIIDSSTNRLPFCDNTLLLNSIRKVINDFTLDARLNKTKDFDENIFQTQGKNLLPEILQVPNLKNILSMPQIENMIVEKVKDTLSYATAIPRKDFTNEWSHGVIKNTLHSILDALSGFHYKLPPMTLKEHQFKDGQWKINLVTLAPILDQKLSMVTPKNLRESIKDLLSFPIIASQIDQDIVRNIIVQSVKNSLTNDEDIKIDDSVIHTLNDVLQLLKDSKNIDALEKSSEAINDEDLDVTYMQEIPTNNYEIGTNIGNSILNSKQNLDVKKDIKMDNKRIQTTDYQKAKVLENNANILITSEIPQLLQLYEKKEDEQTTNKNKVKEDIKDPISSKIKKIDMQDDAEKKVDESLKPKIIYHKATLQNNPSILELNSTGAEQYVKNHRINNENDKETTTITNFMQETPPNYVQVSDGKNLENMLGDKYTDEEVKYPLNENTLTTTTDKIDPLIILERIKFDLPPTKYYSPEILKYATNRIKDKNVEITTASTNFVQKTSSNYAQDGTHLQNIVETKEGNEMEYPLTTTSGNLIPSTNIGYNDYKPTIISLTDKNILESQQQNFTKDNVIKIHEITTEVQRTYEKTTYFKAGLSNDDSPRISSPSSTYQTTNVRINNDNENDNGDDNSKLIGNKMNNINNDMKAKKVIVSSSKSSATDNIYPSQLFPSMIPSDDISKLQRSQLYYISDGVQLPLEIKRLNDGSYALLISKNICEQLLTRKCPCCVPLQGHIVRLLKNPQEDMSAITLTTVEKKNQKNTYGNNIERDYQSVQPFNTAITRRNALRTQNSMEQEEEEKERLNAYLWKQNDNDLAKISMPVIDFAKKYNLLLDFNEKEILLNKPGLQNKIQNNKLIVKAVERFEHQSEEKNLDNHDNIKKNRLLEENYDTIDKFPDLINILERKNTPNMNFPIFPNTKKFSNLGKNSKESEVREANAEMNQSEIDQELKLHEVETTNNIQNTNMVQKINSGNQEKTDPVVKGTNTSEESKIGKEEIKWDQLSDIAKGNINIFHKRDNREHEATELINNDNIPEDKNFKENTGKPYRYQRNTNDVGNKRTELLKSMLYWLKGFFVE